MGEQTPSTPSAALHTPGGKRQYELPCAQSLSLLHCDVCGGGGTNDATTVATMAIAAMTINDERIGQ
jgi:hypothetical protein